MKLLHWTSHYPQMLSKTQVYWRCVNGFVLVKVSGELENHREANFTSPAQAIKTGMGTILGGKLIVWCQKDYFPFSGQTSSNLWVSLMGKIWPPICIGFFQFLKTGQLSLDSRWKQRNAKLNHTLAVCAKSWKFLGCTIHLHKGKSDSYTTQLHQIGRLCFPLLLYS